MKLLLCGNNSFAAKGFYENLKEKGYDIDCFSRGSERRNGDFVTGDVFSIEKNKYLKSSYDAVINFIIIKNEGVERNLEYVQSLDRFCSAKDVKRLLHISSISVYPNCMGNVDETSNIAKEPTGGIYSSVKIAVDQFFLNKRTKYKVTFIRPGFIISKDKEPSLAGIAIPLPLNYSILLGDKKSSLPLIEKEKLHEGIVAILQKDSPWSVYLFLENRNGKKRTLLRKQREGKVLPLPKVLTILGAKIARGLKIFSAVQLQQVRGLFKSTQYDSSASEENLSISFTKNSIGVIGAGAYGSYVINSICKKYPDAAITLYDVGDNHIKNEKEIGFKSNILKKPYTGLSDGRFFGLGGATAKWGGQILTFSKKDFKSPSKYLDELIEINLKYREKVFQTFSLDSKIEEKDINDKLYIKTGLWLSYFKRNLFYYFDIGKKQNVTISKNSRITNLISEGSKIIGFEYIQEGKSQKAYFDYCFLTAGAFESNRILLNSNLFPQQKCKFSDHLSQKAFKIKGGAVIGGEDFSFIREGFSLVTKRLIGEVDGVSYFANPIYNSRFQFFQNLKKLLFKRDYTISIFQEVIKDFPSVLLFIYKFLIEKKMFIYKNNWDIYIDIENPSLGSSISLSEEKDQFGEPALDVAFEFEKSSNYILKMAKEEVKSFLIANKVSFEEYEETLQVEKSEDTYHPYGMMSNFNSVHEYFTLFENMLVLNTGILPRAGGINTTGAVFPLIEEYIDSYFEIDHE